MLQGISGVGMGVSSAIVALSFPDEYGVIDPIVWKVIYGKKKEGCQTTTDIWRICCVHHQSSAGQAITQENLTKLQAIKMVFVDGNSESADKIREHLESQSCFKLVNNKSKADAVMSVSEENKPGEGMQWVVASITVTTLNGDQIWSRSKGGGGFVYSGAGMATDNLLHDLRKDACPGWSRQNK